MITVQAVFAQRTLSRLCIYLTCRSTSSLVVSADGPALSLFDMGCILIFQQFYIVGEGNKAVSECPVLLCIELSVYTI